MEQQNHPEYLAGRKAAKDKMDLPPGASQLFTDGWESHWAQMGLA